MNTCETKRGTPEWKASISLARRRNNIRFNCDCCGAVQEERPSHYAKKVRHFCDSKCYANWRRDSQPIEEHPRWMGGVSQAESNRRWKAKNPERMAHMKARRYARERGAEGSHTHEEWKVCSRTCDEMFESSTESLVCLKMCFHPNDSGMNGCEMMGGTPVYLSSGTGCNIPLRTFDGSSMNPSNNR